MGRGRAACEGGDLRVVVQLARIRVAGVERSEPPVRRFRGLADARPRPLDIASSQNIPLPARSRVCDESPRRITMSVGTRLGFGNNLSMGVAGDEAEQTLAMVGTR